MKNVTGIIRKGEKFYIGECLEIDVVTQGKTIDETIQNLKEAVYLYFEGEKIGDIYLPEEGIMGSGL
ncbi:type II toxin-antitoxin system HicB family antitoxin [candidate division WOR-3 bacterium]|nr:type II toxin-antitoxin system HicB family antitoxin [candidate division WOR-3 bacterium]